MLYTCWKDEKGMNLVYGINISHYSCNENSYYRNLSLGPECMLADMWYSASAECLTL